MQKLLSCYFEEAQAVSAPPNATVWTTLQYSDRKGWYPLPDHEKFQLKPTRFDDKRIKFLDPAEETPAELKETVSGKYFIKSWAREGCAVAVEGDQRVLMKLTNFDNVLTYDHTERLPTFLKAWKPLVFLVNKKVAWVRLTVDLAFVVTCSSSGALTVNCIDYNGGYLCSHPFTDLGLAYGSYAVPALNSLPPSDVEVMPRVEGSSGNWGFWLQFYEWGVMKIPKTLDFFMPQMLMGVVGMAKRRNVVGVIFVPPRLYLRVELDGPGNTSRQLTYGKDWAVTAKKTSTTDVEVYLLMDGQLMKNNHSFDIRINKVEKSASTFPVKFRFTITKEEANAAKQSGAPQRFAFKGTKEMEVVLSQGCPTEQLNHLHSDQLHSIFDAETCQYFIHPVGVKLCNSFSKVAHPLPDQDNE